jgi:hypothetical protein
MLVTSHAKKLLARNPLTSPGGGVVLRVLSYILSVFTYPLLLEYTAGA